MTRTATAVAGVALGGGAAAAAQTGPAVGSRVLGANDRVVVASVGIRGQGNALKRGFATLKSVEIKTLCDIDANLFASRVNDPKLLADCPTFKPGTAQDLRRVLDDKDVDAILVATPNHWHALATIWGLQAGKHVYVEKPASHTVWEGRKMVEAARRYNKIVQVGTMNRSRPAVAEAIKFIHDGGIGEVYMARGLCYKARPNIGRYPDGPMQPGEKYKLNVEAKDFEPTYDAAYLSKVDYDLWLGPAPQRPFNRNRFHYNWHWHWDYGNGDTGNQGPHQFDIARWGLDENVHPAKISSAGGLFGVPRQLAGDAERPLDALHLRRRQGPRVRDPRHHHQRRGDAEDRQPLLRHQGLGLDRRRRPHLAVLPRPQGREGPGGDGGGGRHGQRSRTSSPASSTRTTRTSSTPSAPATAASSPARSRRATSPPRSPTSPTSPTGSAARSTFDGKTEKFKDDREADALLTRPYRAPYVIPDKV